MVKESVREAMVFVSSRSSAVQRTLSGALMGVINSDTDIWTHWTLTGLSQTRTHAFPWGHFHEQNWKIETIDFSMCLMWLPSLCFLCFLPLVFVFACPDLEVKTYKLAIGIFDFPLRQRDIAWCSLTAYFYASGEITTYNMRWQVKTEEKYFFQCLRD